MDVSTSLKENVRNHFANAYGKDDKILYFMQRVKSGHASYRDAYDYSKRIGEILGDAFSKNIVPEALPNGRLYWNIAKSVVDPMIRENHKLVNVAGTEASKFENSEAGIKLGSVSPNIDEERLSGLLESITEEDIEPEVLSRRLNDHTVNISEYFFDSYVRENADFQYQSGMDPQVIRIYHSGGACNWCKSLAGVYEYSDVNYRGCEVWQRHSSCHCSIIFKSNKDKYMEGAHTKRRLESFSSSQELLDLDKVNNYGSYTKQIHDNKSLEYYYKTRKLKGKRK